jgi:hypothetical protein
MSRVLYLLLSKIRLACLIKRPKIAVVGRASKQKINIELPLRFPQLIEQGLPMHRLLDDIRWLQQLKALRLMEAQVAARGCQVLSNLRRSSPKDKTFSCSRCSTNSHSRVHNRNQPHQQVPTTARGSINKKWLLLTSPPRINELGYSHG